MNISYSILVNMKKKLSKIIVLLIYFTSNLLECLTLEKIADINNGWGMTFLNNEEIFLSEKKGKLKIVNINNKTIKNISHNLKYSFAGQGGLLDLINEDNKIWISYAERLDNGTTTSVAYGILERDSIYFDNIFRANPILKSNFHYGSKLLLKDGYLYITIGDRGKGMIAQDPKKHPGSIIRIKVTEKKLNNNSETYKKENWLSEIYQIGYRNPQGIALSPYDNKIYVTNHGAMGGDWFGEVKFGGNYGWKILGWGGKNYIGTNIGPKWKKGFSKPIYYWVPSIGISSLIIYKGKEFSDMNGYALITSLKDQSLIKLNFKKKNLQKRLY